jgi:hypothetical protein
MPRPPIEDFLRIIPQKFGDCLTNAPARSERELSVVLSAKHQFRDVDWRSIPIWPVGAGDSSAASDIIGADDFVFTEYPLFAVSPEHADRWGQMAPDLVFLGRNRDRLTLVECKVDSYFTHDREPPNDQLSRYCAFLLAAPVNQRNLLLVSPRCNHDWYEERLRIAKEYLANPKIGVFSTHWEHVFEAIKD